MWQTARVSPFLALTSTRTGQYVYTPAFLKGGPSFFIFTKMIAGFMFLELALVYWVSSLMHTEIMGTGTDVERGCCFETTELRLIT